MNAEILWTIASSHHMFIPKPGMGGRGGWWKHAFLSAKMHISNIDFLGGESKRVNPTLELI